jgi:hypothetical protein
VANSSPKKNNTANAAKATNAANAAKATNAANAAKPQETVPPTSQLVKSETGATTVGGWAAKAGIPVKHAGGRRRRSSHRSKRRRTHKRRI